MNSLNKLTELFRQFPGIGPRQAKRFVYFLLASDKEFLSELARLINGLNDEIAQCSSCFRFFQKGRSALCDICADKNRNDALLAIVTKDTDLEAMEKSGTYDGRYFVLGGTAPLLEKKKTEELRVKECARLAEKKAKDGTLKEIILAFNANPDGEHTADELQRLLSPLAEKYALTISTLGRGLSTGSELEYADPETLKSAFKNRSK